MQVMKGPAQSADHAARARRLALRKAGSWDEVRAIVDGVDASRMDSGLVESIARATETLPGPPDVRMAFLSDCTLAPLARHVSALAATNGIRVQAHLGPYDQHFQQVLDASSSLHDFQPNAIFLHLSLAALAPELHDDFLATSAERRREAVNEIVQQLQAWVSEARARTSAMLLLTNFPRPAFPVAGVADWSLDFGQAEFYQTLNLALLSAFRSDPRVAIVDLEMSLGRGGHVAADNQRLHYLARIPWSEGAMRDMAAEIQRHLQAIRGTARKCLVVDLDNTLWGGVLGEAGVWGVKVGDGDPEFRAYADMQRVVRSLKHRGVLLAICSKNNHDDVLELFAQRPDMPLALDDFVATRINWQPKPDNVRSLAEELNIGTDSLVFMDDNPVECGLMCSALPEVQTILLPDDVTCRPSLLGHMPLFERHALTDEDRARGEQYRQQAVRQRLVHASGNLEDFLQGLETRLRIEVAGAQHCARIAQLIGKTNQFNLTTRRYTAAEVEDLLVDDACLVLVGSVSDRYGDLGLVLVCIVRLDGSMADIDSLLMSCRAMGRGIETAFMNTLKSIVFGEHSVQELRGQFLPTRKNPPVRDYLDNQGFQLVDETPDGARRYRLNAGYAESLSCSGITVESLL